MKILYLTHFFPPTHTNGTENYTLAIASGFKRQGHEVRVLCAGDWDQGERCWNGFRDEIYQEIPVRRLNLNWKKAPDPNLFLYRNPLVGAYLAEYLREYRPDVVHITSCYSLSATILETVKAAGLPIVVTLTDFWFLCPRIQLMKASGGGTNANEVPAGPVPCDGRVEPYECLACQLAGSGILRLTSLPPVKLIQRPLLTAISKIPLLRNRRGLVGMALDISGRRAYLRKTLALADAVVAPSAAMKEYFDLSGWQLPMKVQHYGHDLSWLSAYPGKTPSNVTRFGFIGQTHPQKGLHLLIEAVKQVARDLPIELFVYGRVQDTAYATALLKSAASEPRIHFMGYIPRGELPGAFSQIDCLVVPSTWHENNPLVIQEAFAARTPVIASSGRGMAEFVRHGENGLLFRMGDASHLAECLRLVATRKDLLDSFRANIPPVKTIAVELDELTALYQTLAGRGEQP